MASRTDDLSGLGADWDLGKRDNLVTAEKLQNVLLASNKNMDAIQIVLLENTCFVFGR